MRNICVLLVVFCVLISGCGRQSMNYDKGKEYFEVGDFKKAANFFNKAIKEDKNVSDDIYFYIAVTSEKLGDYDNAIKNYKYVLNDDFKSEFKENQEFVNKIKNELNNLYIKYAIEEGVKGNIKKSQILIENAGTPYEWRLYYLGVIAYQRLEYRKAKGIFESALQAKGKDDLDIDINYTLQVHLMMARLFRDMYNATREKEDFLKSLREIKLCFTLGTDVMARDSLKIEINQFYQKLKNMDIFEDIYSEVDMSFDKVKIYQRGEEWEKLIKPATFILDNTPLLDDKFYISIILGQAYTNLKDKENALKHYKNALIIGRGIRDIIITRLEAEIQEDLKKLGYEFDERR